MNKRDELAKRAAEIAAEKAYERYGEKLPVNVNPDAVADKAFEVVKRRHDKKKQHHFVKMVKIVAIGTVGTMCVVGLTAGAIVKAAHDR